MYCYKSIFYKALCFAVLLTAKSFVAHANDFVRIKSTTTGQNIYEVVFESKGRDTTKDKAGIYAIQQDGKQTPVILGNVLGVSKGFNGILAQTSQGVTGDTAESLAIVNGNLVLFNKNTFNSSKAVSRKGSKAVSRKAFVLGGSKFSVFDPLLGLHYEFSDGAIENLDDISIKAVEHVSSRIGLINGGTLFLASIKKHSGFGDGITLAFIVENPVSDESQPKVYRDHAVVLDYKFVDEKALDYLVVKDKDKEGWNGQLFSHNVVKVTLRELGSEAKDPLISRWIKYMKDSIKKIESKSFSQHSGDNLMGSPVFDMFVEQIVYRGIPARPLMGGDMPLHQIYDPNASSWSVVETDDTFFRPEPKENQGRVSDLGFIVSDKFDKQSVFIPGRVKYDEKKQYKALQLDPKNKNPIHSEYSITVGDSIIVLLRDRDHKIKALRVDDVVLPDIKKIEIVHSRHTTKHVLIHYLFLSMTSKNGKQDLKVLTLDEHASGFRIINKTNLMQKHMSREEIILRSRFYDNDEVARIGLYFDVTTSVRGATYYRRSLAEKKQEKNVDEEHLSRKITPYLFLPISPSESVNRGDQAFLRAAKLIEGIEKGVMTFLQFGDKKLEQSSAKTTGFYIDYRKNPDAVESETLNLNEAIFLEKFEGNRILGKPLHIARGKKSPMVLSSIDIKLEENNPSVELSVVPFLSNIKGKSSQKDFSAIVVASSTESGLSRPDTKVLTFKVPGEFDSFVGMQIIKGLRNRSSNFHVLFFFGKNNQSTTKGLYLMSGRLGIDRNGATESYRLKSLHGGSWLHKEKIDPSEIRRKIKADAQGELYWLDNPEDFHSSGLKGRSMSNPGNIILFNLNDQHNRPIRLRFDEDPIGVESSDLLYSKWKVIGDRGLFEKFSWFAKYVEGLNKKIEEMQGDSFKINRNRNGWTELHKASNPRFFSFLEKLARKRQDGEEPKRQVVLVEERMKQAFLKDMSVQLIHSGEDFSVKMRRHNHGGDGFEFFSYDVASTLEEGREEVKHIVDNAQSRPVLLYSSIDDINSADPLVREKETLVVTEDESNLFSPSAIRVKEKPSRWLFLATNGQSSFTSRIHSKLKKNAVRFPTFILGTPEEWKAAKKNNPDDVKKGVFDQFEINSEFLTGPWKLWSPGSQYATPAVNKFAEAPITEEEYRVFPELESFFSGAAKGDFKGEQKVILVSEELKPLIHKLIMTRWATASERSKGVWHHGNENLAVYQLQGTREENTQTQVFENFQAMRGGSEHLSVVFYSDLERIGQLGRPFNGVDEKSDTYKLEDPILGAGRQDSIFSKDSVDHSSKTVPVQYQELSIQRLEIENLNIRYRDEIEDLEASIRKYKDDIQLETIGEPKNQTSELESKIRELEGKTNELLGKIESNEERIYGISDQIEMIPNVSGASGESTVLPHLMWLIATEGNKVQPHSSRDWSLDSAMDRQYTTILLGTEDEWNQIDQDLGSFESKYLDISKHFDIVKLKAPSEEIKATLVQNLFKRPEIQGIGYHFEIPDQSQEDARRQLIYHFVNRVEQIAIQQGIESTTAFIRAFSEFRHVLIEDVALRRSRTIDKNFLERLFFKIFPLPISIENLEQDDPLRRVSNSVTKAARQLQSLGYHGAMELKKRIFETLLSQTKGSDGGRPIPNSQIYFGGTSSGKTYLFRKKVEYLGLTEYDASKASNEEADYIVISVQNLVDHDTEEVGKMTVDKAIEMIEDLLSQPKGHRAFILIDDAHKTSSAKVHQRLFTFIQSLFEAPNGVVKVHKRGINEFKEVPVQNLNLYMTVNPTANKKQREKFAEGNNLNKLVLAALANHSQDMEDSILARWSDIIDLDKFPRGAKVPALVERIRNQSKASTNSTVLVSSTAIDAIVNKFPNANAREFLIPASSALTRIPSEAKRSSLYIVTERGEIDTQSEVQDSNMGFLISKDLNKAVRELTEVDAIRLDEPLSLLKLVNFLMSNFRMQVFNHMVLSAQNTDILKLDAPGQTTIIQKNYIIAVMAHLLKNPRLPVSELKISGTDFSYLDQLTLEELVEIQQQQRLGKKSYFPFTIGNQKNFSVFHPSGFMEDEILIQSKPRSRQDVFADTAKEIEQIFKEMLKLYTRLQKTTLIDTLTWDRDDRQVWFESLQQEDQIEAYKELSNQLLKVYMRFIGDFYNRDLIEMKQSEQTDFTIYEQVRLFTFLVDKAITQLPWGLMSKFVLDVMDSASDDLSLGQKPHFINYAYMHQISPLSIQTSDFLNETFANEVSDKLKLDKDDTKFIESCSVSLGSVE